MSANGTRTVASYFVTGPTSTSGRVGSSVRLRSGNYGSRPSQVLRAKPTRPGAGAPRSDSLERFSRANSGANGFLHEKLGQCVDRPDRIPALRHRDLPDGDAFEGGT